jgi:succinate dehydrogenase/fumarate reductase flavoprotein subunit
MALDMKRLHEPARGLILFQTQSVVWATGGEAGMFEASVYPENQHGALGVAMEAGAEACNLQEWQHGLASVKFRWNVSGTYQQVLPRYVSTNANGSDEKEFLLDYMAPSEALALTFLKGYQWPFDARKLPGSSLIDVYVHIETSQKGRRVFLDYRSNPKGLEDGFGMLTDECSSYLKKSDALFGTPYDRLTKMNPEATKLFQEHGIDIAKEMLEIALCAQHMNGGLEVDHWWRTNIEGFYACGESGGTFGAYRPGGSALNSTQTGSLRAAQHIASTRCYLNKEPATFVKVAIELLDKKGNDVLNVSIDTKGNLQHLLSNARMRMSQCGAYLRRQEGIETALEMCRKEITHYWKDLQLSSIEELPDAFQAWDMLLSQYACMSAMQTFIMLGGPSRGSALILSEEGEGLPGVAWKFRPYSNAMNGVVLQTSLITKSGGIDSLNWLRLVRPIPERDLWFENVWAEYRAKNTNLINQQNRQS